MRKFIENSYSKVLKKVFKITNPIKKQVVKTECKVHKFINNQAILILKNDGNIKQYNFFAKHIPDINVGAVWADQDYKSTNHFYNPDSAKGLYGFSNAHIMCVHYYTIALTKYLEGDEKGAMFYLGAACHLIQDVTIPQHVNVKLLKHHRKYEQWVIKAFELHDEFKAKDSGIYLNTIKQYIDYNTKVAIGAYNEYINEENLDTRFYKTTLIILVTAQKTTSGLMMNFYKDIVRIKNKSTRAIQKRVIKLSSAH